MLYSRLLIILAVVIVLFVDMKAPLPDIFKLTGCVLISLCAMGRLYTTVFIGGHKNDSVIVAGPYSILRHPLYFFSILGMTGISFLTTNLLVILVFPTAFVLLYLALIQREEMFLSAKFGGKYTNYMHSTRRLIPRFSQYSAPETIVVKPTFVKNAFSDAVWWLSALPLIEALNYLKGSMLN